MEIQTDGTINRRDFAKGAVMGGVALLGAATLTASLRGETAYAAHDFFKSDLEILNYALTLDHFEAELYRQIIAGGKLQGRDLQYVTLFGQQEADHVKALIPVIQKLGGTPVQPAKYKFPAPATREEVLGLLNVVEQTGVGASLGVATALKLYNKDLLPAAASIMQVEGRHTAVIRFLLGLPPVPDAFTPAFTPQEVLEKVKPFFEM
jgi:hypothetical protein